MKTSNEKIWEKLVEKGSQIRGGALYYPGYYSTTQIVISRIGGVPEVRYDGRGHEPSRAEAQKIIDLYDLVERLKE